ncbi:MAG: uracil-DNA glycosylase [Halobacteriovoraceae bacterium]|nr:uracil-DNA glycosylase [Halobacteriovoraceae bacterium]
MNDIFKINKSWQVELQDEFTKDYFLGLKSFLSQEIKAEKIIYPEVDQIFTAFDLTPFNKTKVIIIGQDPYHGPNQAHGLSFSVKSGERIPPSLKNIYNEIKLDLGHEVPEHGELTAWAKQGVLLLNTVLTVEKGKPASHRKKGWEIFTDKVIQTLSQKKENLVFILWGSPAQKKENLIDQKKHLILKSVHPSPLSAHRGFFNNHHFSKANEFLLSKGLSPINWDIKSIN